MWRNGMNRSMLVPLWLRRFPLEWCRGPGCPSSRRRSREQRTQACAGSQAEAPGFHRWAQLRSGHRAAGAARAGLAGARGGAAAGRRAAARATGADRGPAGRHHDHRGDAPGARVAAGAGAGGRPGQAGAGLGRLVGPGRHAGRRDRLWRVADRAELTADHRAARAGRGVPARLLDRRARLAAHYPVAGRVRRGASRLDVRQYGVRSGRLRVVCGGLGWCGWLGRGRCGDRAGVHARAGHPAGRWLVDPRHGGGGADSPDTRCAGPGHVRRPGRPSDRPAVGAPRRGHPRPQPARDIHQPGRVPPAAGADPGAGRAVPGGRLADQPARPGHAGRLRRLAALAGLAAAAHRRRRARRAGARHDHGGVAGRAAVPDPHHPVPRRGRAGPPAGGHPVRRRRAGRPGVWPGRRATGRARPTGPRRASQCGR